LQKRFFIHFLRGINRRKTAAKPPQNRLKNGSAKRQKRGT
jgi:hypothetical protein